MTLNHMYENTFQKEHIIKKYLSKVVLNQFIYYKSLIFIPSFLMFVKMNIFRKEILKSLCSKPKTNQW